MRSSLSIIQYAMKRLDVCDGAPVTGWSDPLEHGPVDRVRHSGKSPRIYSWRVVVA